MKHRRENMPKKFELSIVFRRGDSFELKSINTIESNDLVGLTSKIPLMIAQLMQELADYEKAKEVDAYVQSGLPF
jgi:NhaP-type Na+/H+ and K+/H+ antiporter